MRVAVFTQDERLFLPHAVGALVEAIPEQIACLVLAPPMSTHGGKLKGLKRHLPVFGLKGTSYMGGRIIASYLAEMAHIRPAAGQYWSMRQIGKRFNIPVIYLDKLAGQRAHQVVDQYPADLLVSVSCPQIIPGDLLHRFRHGGINVHSAPLPKYRGLMPGFWVLYHNEPNTAVTVHVLGDRLDNGDILSQWPVTIDKDETWISLTRKTKSIAGRLLVDVINKIESGSVENMPNRDEDSTYFSFPTAGEAREFRRRGRRIV